MHRLQLSTEARSTAGPRVAPEAAALVNQTMAPSQWLAALAASRGGPFLEVIREGYTLSG